MDGTSMSGVTTEARCIVPALGSFVCSDVLGRPSFRDNEVNWDYVRVLPDGETVSMDGTHLGTWQFKARPRVRALRSF